MDVNQLNSQLLYLEDTKQQIKEALINKGQTISDDDTFRSYVEKINDITTSANLYELSSRIECAGAAIGDLLTLSSTEYPELINGTENDYFVGNLLDINNLNYWLGIFKLKQIIGTRYMVVVEYLGADTYGTASSDDIITDKLAWVNGNKVVGTLPVSDELTPQVVSSVYSSDTNLILRNSLTTPICIKPGGGLSAPNDIVISAIRLTEDVIKEGTKILGITGTLKIGVDTTDATATEDDIALNKVAYVKGSRLVGTIPTHDDTIVSSANTTSSTASGLRISTSGTTKEIITDTSNILVDISNDAIVSAIKLKANTIKQGTTIFGVTGTLEEVPSNTTKVTSGNTYSSTSSNSISTNGNYLYIQHNNSSNLLMYSGSSSSFGVLQSTAANTLGITADVLKKDTTILGITGTYIGEAGTGTEDATATAGDIVEGKTAYANKVKIEGIVPLIENSKYTPSLNTVTYNTTYSRFDVTTTAVNSNTKYTNGVMLKGTSYVSFSISQSDIANAIGLTPDMIAEGSTVLGIVGTHTGSGMLTEEEYNDCEALANQILAITE